MNVKNPEILAPGGDFNSAIHALNSGADAVYVGLKSFSARKRATNFTMDELRRLKTFCLDRSKKIYVAINTLLTNSEISEIFPLLQELEEIEVDGIIVQDLGLISLLKDNTKLTIHASTQLAIHNIHGARVLEKLGVTRAVLSRELTLEEIIKIKESSPKLELEIFIHGALCYGFSGLCLASSKILGRSANKGECGQICRTWFNNNGKKEFYFSMNDLSLGDKILKLKEIGVESLKIEGRLKGPAYASSTANLYYNILNGKKFNEISTGAKVEFNRNGGDAYLLNREKVGTINKKYPGHTGVEVGQILDIKSDSFTIITNEKIENRDGLMVFINKEILEPFKFSANILSKQKSKVVLKGRLPRNIDKTIYKISSHDTNLKEEKAQKFKPYKTPIELTIIIKHRSINIKTANLDFNYPIEVETANAEVDIESQFNKIFYPGGETNYCFPSAVVSEVERPFIQLSKLKEVRNLFQADFLSNKKIKDLLLTGDNVEYLDYIRNSGTLPFVTNFSEVALNKLKQKDGKYLLPLAPVIFDSITYEIKLREFLNNHSDKDFIIGLNNLSHIEFIDNIDPKVEYYCDYGLYSLNSFSNRFLYSKIPNLKWVTRWVEGGNNNYPPLFISRTCFKAQQDGCPKNCPKKYNYEISQNGKFRVVVRECITYTLTESNESAE